MAVWVPLHQAITTTLHSNLHRPVPYTIPPKASLIALPPAAFRLYTR